MQELIIVLKIPGGFAVDISYAREEYTLDKTGGIKLAARSEPPYACEGFTVVKAPGVALIASELDRQRFRAQVKQRYGFEHPEIDISQFQR
jgi:hypothetical protein